MRKTAEKLNVHDQRIQTKSPRYAWVEKMAKKSKVHKVRRNDQDVKGFQSEKSQMSAIKENGQKAKGPQVRENRQNYRGHAQSRKIAKK